MKFYNKRGDDISIDKSKTLNEIFFPISIDKKKTSNEIKEEVIENYIFLLQGDKMLTNYSDNELLNFNINIVPHYKRHRFKYFFNNFNEMYNYFIKEHKFKSIIPYEGFDLFK